MSGAFFRFGDGSPLTKLALSPPEVVIVTQVHDTKVWMSPHTPSLHDHLKAHQFKFQKKPGEEVLQGMEW